MSGNKGVGIAFFGAWTAFAFLHMQQAGYGFEQVDTRESLFGKEVYQLQCFETVEPEMEMGKQALNFSGVFSDTLPCLGKMIHLEIGKELGLDFPRQGQYLIRIHCK